MSSATKISMSTVAWNNSAAQLIAAAERYVSLEELAHASAVDVGELHRCRHERHRLRPLEQLRLARAVERHVPALARQAKRLEGQATATLVVESGDTTSHLTYPRSWTIRR